jgi:glycosyltransferase involved in cell wall biosynthesis
MRVSFLSAAGALGGAERVLLESVSALRGLRPEWPVRVVCLADGPLLGELAGRGAEVTLLPLPAPLARVGEAGRARAATLAGLARSVWPLRAYARRLGAELAAWAPEVVHANGLKADVLAAWLAPPRARVVWHLHDYVTSRWVSSALLRRYAPRVAAVIANSQSVSDDARAAMGARTRVEVVHNGVDTAYFTPDGAVIDLDAAAGLPPASPGVVRVGLVATYARWKGHETFLRAASRVRTPDIRSYVIGGPVYQTTGSQYSRAELEDIARRLGLAGRVGFVPFVPDTAPAHRALDIVVHASTRPEPFGLSVVEAMACGRAVIASAAGGVCELVTEHSALLHPPGDDAALADGIASLAADAGMRARLGLNARAEAVRRFDRMHFGRALVTVYDSFLADDGVTPPRGPVADVSCAR